MTTQDKQPRMRGGGAAIDNEHERNGNVYIIVSEIKKFFNIILIIIIIVFIAIYFISSHYSALLDKNMQGEAFWWENIYNLLMAVSANFLPIVIIAALIKPFYSKLIKIQMRDADIRRMSEIRTIIKNSEARIIDNAHELASKFFNTKMPIEQFYESFYDVDWPSVLKDAKYVHISAFYWTKDWMTSNIPTFAAAVQEGCEVTCYFASPTRHQNQWTTQSPIDSKIQENIVLAATLFQKALTEAGAQCKVFFVRKSVNYMLARVMYSGKSVFMFSPFQMSESTKAGRPPLVVVDETRATSKMKAFIDGELRHLQSGLQLVDLEASKYITWSDDATRVIISVALACPAHCTFCYVESVKDGDESEIKDKEMLSLLLVYYVLEDPRFKEGQDGSIIFIGGLADPFYIQNVGVTIRVLRLLHEKGISNIIHVATRYCINSLETMQQILRYKNVIINYSLSSFDEESAYELKNVRERFEEARNLLLHNAKVALYIRPVIPGVTNRSIPDIIRAASGAGIRHVVVGGLYVDDRITNMMNIREQLVAASDRGNKKMVLDRKGKLFKVAGGDVDAIRKQFVDAGFQVYNSSYEIAREFSFM